MAEEKAKKNVIQIVLDRSGSMASQWGGVEEGFDGFIKGQLPFDDTVVNLIHFDSVEVKTEFEDVPVKKVKSLKKLDIEPRGGTPLYDAIGAGIKAVEALKDVGKVVFVIYTDGYENASHQYTKKQIFSKITKHRKKHDWQFVFMGADQDAYAEGTALGVAAASTFSYAGTNAGAKGSTQTLTRATQDYLVGASASVDMGQTPPSPEGAVTPTPK